VENIWRALKQNIHQADWVDSEELFKEIQRSWDAIPQELINKYCEEMPDRIQQLIDRHGNMTQY
jgi:hypothetical protein